MAEAFGATVKLYQRLAMHGRLQGGALYLYNISDESGQIVGSKSVHLNKKTRTEITAYTIGDQTFDTADEFRRAYQQTLRDKEWDAAEPKHKEIK